MRFLRFLSAILLLPAAIVWAQTPTGQANSGPQAGADAPRAPSKPFTLTIPGFADGSDIPVKYTQVAGETSPAITWTNAPAGTMSFFLYVHDMDNTRNHGTEDLPHWLVWNIPATSTGLPEGVPKAAQMENGAYQLGVRGPAYRGPGASAAGPRHHYAFELFALDVNLDLQPVTDAYEMRANLLKAIQGHILGKAVYVGLFHRPQ